MIKSYRSNDIAELMGPVETQYGPPASGQCSEQQVAGADAPETRNIEMGATSGNFNFSWEMLSQHDRMIVRYGATQLYDTGCVSGSGSVNLAFSGASSIITVEVIPNCNPATANGTLWYFTVSCPQ
ncbi:MAG TPA: hypothetical protein PKE26_07790 [Kiritimatiellia bacterium]|nr:hypothetical protein [Kiritimatiellia bacterium]HMO98993.1 hypothetical protein [Kiritimatiellia bacterium]HMP95880.1 hypothetical protein [Kiritimatiellia bacterium]